MILTLIETGSPPSRGYQANTEEVIQLKKVLSNLKTIALKSKKTP